MGYWGGPAVGGEDGWLTYGSAASQGILWQSSVEIVEQQQPILIEELAIRQDSGGAGEFQVGPGSRVVMRPRFGPVRFAINAAAHDNPPEGVRGGEPGERLVSEACGGGGYGEPAGRSAERIRRDVAEGWISAEQAASAYGSGRT